MKIRKNIFNNKILRYALMLALACFGSISAQAKTYPVSNETSLNTGSQLIDIPCLQSVTVTSLLDSGAGSLRQAVVDVCAGGTITFGVTGIVGLTSGQIALNKNVSIQGPGADQLNISRTSVAKFRIFSVDNGKNVNISGVTISNGDSTVVGGGGFGAGILSYGNLNLNGVVLTGLKGENGTAVTNAGGSLSVANSTISNNTSLNQASGVYTYNSNPVSFVNTTISGNTCRTQGGAIFFSGPGVGPYALNITNSTITNNNAGPEGDSTGGGGISLYSATPQYGGHNAAINATLRNTIVAGNGPNNFKVDLDGGSPNAKYISGGYNIDGDGISGFINGVNGDKVGTPISPLNALLAPLGANGGPTPTHALLAGSPAIDGGLNSGGLTTDQRGAGFARTVDLSAVNSGDGTDIGAFEVQVDFDTTPPVITPNVSGTTGNNGWYTSDVEVAWSVSDAESNVTNQTGCTLQTVTADTNGVTFTCSATSAGGSDSQSVTIKRDATAPSIGYVNHTAPNSNGWNNADVTVNWNCSDALSGAVNPNISQTLTAEGSNQSATGTCYDNAGNSAANTQNGINIDKTAPTLAPTVTPNPVSWRGLATAAANATDNLSGIASQSCPAVDTSTVGTKSLTCTATDLAGNTNTANVSYVVTGGYNFTGFFQPVDNLPTINSANAGQSIPLKFSLGGNQGLNVFAPGYPISTLVPCDATEPGSTIEETVNAGGSSLSYNSTTDQYSYVWKTDKAWKGTCRMLVLKLADGTQYYAKFRFR